MRGRVTVVTAQFEDLVKVGLRQLISESSNLELVAHDVTLDRIENVIAKHRPDVALLNFGSLDSPASVYALHERHPDTRIVVLANRPTTAEANQLLSLGATACISKETQGRDIINAIHLASRGMHVLPRSASMMPSSADGFELPGPELLTQREADVLELLQNGRSNKEIAAKLSIGIETVRTHASNIYRKLGISSRRDLANLTRAERTPSP
jgi:DNA-binding NarL/FixJ family response regulator